jgi:hypothetical protein
MEYGIKVYMDKRDVTFWVQAVRVQQVDGILRKFELDFRAWHSFDESNRWDIFETYDPTGNPRAEVVIRNGIIPADRTRVVRVDDSDVPRVRAEGYEYVWLAMRRAPNETAVLVPGVYNRDHEVQKALDDFDGDPGNYRVWPGVRTLHDAIRKLMQAARIRVQIRIPNRSMSPWVVPPTLSYWEAVKRLSDPYAPVRYYIRSTNTVVIGDPTSPLMGSGSVLNIPEDAVNTIDVQAQRLRRIRRVLLRFPWRS